MCSEPAKSSPDPAKSSPDPAKSSWRPVKRYTMLPHASQCSKDFRKPQFFTILPVLKRLQKTSIFHHPSRAQRTLWNFRFSPCFPGAVAFPTWVGTGRTSEDVRIGPAVSVSGTSYGSKSRVRRHPSQQTKFPVRIRIFWLLRRESFARTLKTTPRQDRRVYTISVRNTKQALSNLSDFWIEIRITKYEIQITN